VLAVLAGIAAASGLVWAAAGTPARRARREARYFRYLVARLEAGDILRDQAADGSVLARRLNDRGLERLFRRAEATLKRRSV